MRFVVAGPSMAAALLCTRFPASPAERVREDVYSLRERRWVLLKIPRCDIDGVGEGK